MIKTSLLCVKFTKFKMEKQFKQILTKEKLLIENSKYYSCGLGNSKKLCKLNIQR